MPTKLSPAMRKLTREWQCSYTLRARLGTMWALFGRGLVDYKGGLGSSWSPRTGYGWRLTKEGEQWLKDN